MEFMDQSAEPLLLKKPNSFLRLASERIAYEIGLAKRFADLAEGEKNWENFLALNLTDEFAKAKAFASMRWDYRTEENFLKLNLQLQIAKAKAFAAVYKKNNWDDFDALNLEDEMAKSIAFAGLCYEYMTWDNYQRLNLQDDRTKAKAFKTLRYDYKTYDYFSRLQLKDDMAISDAFVELFWKPDKIEENCQRLINDVSIKNKTARLNIYFNLPQGFQNNYYNELLIKDCSHEDLVDYLQNNYVCQNGANDNQKKISFNELKQELAETSKLHLGTGIAIGLVGFGLISLAVLHFFCTPFALCLDLALAKIGLTTGVSAIVVPSVFGGIGLLSAILSGYLFSNRKQFPKAPKQVENEIKSINAQKNSKSDQTVKITQELDNNFRDKIHDASEKFSTTNEKGSDKKLSEQVL